MGVAALVSWLLTESLGAWMLRALIAAGLRRPAAQPARMSLPVLFWHAGLAGCGLACWAIFVGTGSAVPAWLAVGILAPAIGLGISTVTIWTPFPARTAGAAGGPGPPGAPAGPGPADPVSDDTIAGALADVDLTARLIDDLLASAFAGEGDQARGQSRPARVLIPAAHGVLAIATFLLVVLAAVGALAGQ